MGLLTRPDRADERLFLSLLTDSSNKHLGLDTRKTKTNMQKGEKAESGGRINKRKREEQRMRHSCMNFAVSLIHEEPYRSGMLQHCINSNISVTIHGRMW